MEGEQDCLYPCPPDFSKLLLWITRKVGSLSDNLVQQRKYILEANIHISRKALFIECFDALLILLNLFRPNWTGKYAAFEKEHVARHLFEQLFL